MAGTHRRTTGASGTARFLTSRVLAGALVVIGTAAAATAVIRLQISADRPSQQDEPSPYSESSNIQPPVKIEPVAIDEEAEVPVKAEAVLEPSIEDLPGSIALDANSIVLLPLDDDTTSAELAGLAQQISDQILHQLSLIDGLNVISGEPVAYYASAAGPEEEIARIFGAGSILAGNIVETDRELKISVSHIDAQTGEIKFGSGSSIRRRRGTYDLSYLANFASNIANHVADSLFRDTAVQRSREQVILDKQAEVLDVDLGDRERLAALGMLRYGGDNARHDAVAVAAVEIATNSDSAALRRQAWEYLEGAGDSYLIQPLLTALEFDPSPDVRRQAAKTLEEYVEEPGVRDALEFAAVSDESANVREQARFAILSQQDQKTMIVSTILDKNLTEHERLSPLRRDYLGSGDGSVLTDQVVSAMVEMAKSSDDPHIRSSVWYLLRGIDNQAIVDPLLEHLSYDPNEQVRTSAASALGEYLDHPGVRDALTEAQASESSRSVRRAARESLDP